MKMDRNNNKQNCLIVFICNLVATRQTLEYHRPESLIYPILIAFGLCFSTGMSQGDS